jgi:hypothetical protein
MSNPIFDGTPDWGSSLITIDSVAFVAESIDIQYTTDVNTLLDEDGVDRANVYIQRAPSGSATIQVDTDQTAPSRGDEFTHAGVDWYITELSSQTSNSSFKKYSMSFRKRLVSAP